MCRLDLTVVNLDITKNIAVYIKILGLVMYKQYYKGRGTTWGCRDQVYIFSRYINID